MPTCYSLTHAASTTRSELPRSQVGVHGLGLLVVQRRARARAAARPRTAVVRSAADILRPAAGGHAAAGRCAACGAAARRRALGVAAGGPRTRVPSLASANLVRYTGRRTVHCRASIALGSPIDAAHHTVAGDPWWAGARRLHVCEPPRGGRLPVRRRRLHARGGRRAACRDPQGDAHEDRARVRDALGTDEARCRALSREAARQHRNGCSGCLIPDLA